MPFRRAEACGRDVCGPSEQDFGKGFGDQESVPGVEGPGARGERVEGADPRGLDELRELRRSRLGDHGGTAGAVDGDGAAVAFAVGIGEGAESGDAAARGGAANGAEAEPLHGSRDELAVEGARDKDGNVLPSEAMGAREQGAMPKSVYGGAGDLVAGDARRESGIGDI